MIFVFGSEGPRISVSGFDASFSSEIAILSRSASNRLHASKSISSSPPLRFFSGGRNSSLKRLAP